MSTPESIEADCAAEAAYEDRSTGECADCGWDLTPETETEWRGRLYCLTCGSTAASQCADSDTLSYEELALAARIVRDRADEIKAKAARRCSEENQRLAALPSAATFRRALYEACKPPGTDTANLALHVIITGGR